MGIRQYILLSLIFLVLIGVYVYTLQGAVYTLLFFGKNITLPIAFWAIIPAAILFLVSTFHLTYYSIKGFFEKRVVKKDYETLVEEIKDILLGEERIFEYKTAHFIMLGKILKKLNYNPDSIDESTGEPKIDEVLELLNKIKSGEYADVRKFRLRNANKVNISNRMNLLSGEKKDIVEVLKHCNNLEEEVCQKAFNMFLFVGTYAEIKKYNYPLDNDMIYKIFERHLDEEDKFKLTETEILEIFKKNEFSSKEYIQFAKMFKNKIEPTFLMNLFEELQSKDAVKTSAYLYLLFEFQMIDKAREFLENTENEEFEKFKILLYLRDNGKLVDTNIFY